MIVESPLRKPRESGDFIDANSGEALSIRELVSGVEEKAAGPIRGSGHGLPRRRECIPISEFTDFRTSRYPIV
jgi:hypothetical protein